MSRELMIAVVAVVTFGGTFAALAALFRAQVRRFNRSVATEVLDDWAVRRGPDAVPPAEVLAAMTALPARGWQSSWGALPVGRLTR
jgi:hypothetical protein